MSTTTTIYPTGDTHIREPNPTTNFGTGQFLPMGEWSGGRRHGLFTFDVSSYTKPSDIIQANFTLVATSSSGGSTRDMTLARLDQSFGETTATWDTYNGEDNWTTAGAEDNAATTEPTYTIQIGTTTNQTVDIKALFIDAINRRAGTLLLVIYFDSGATAYTTFGSTNNANPANKPSIAVVVAERIVWQGGVDGDVENNLNWVGGVAPTTSDFAMFTSGSVNADTNELSCHSLFVGSEYTGTIGTDSSTLLSVTSATTYSDTKRVIDQESANFFIDDVSTRQVTPKLFVSNALKGSVFQRAVTNSQCETIVAGGDFELIGDTNLIASKESVGQTPKVKLSGTATDIKASLSKLELTNGCNNFVLAKGTKCLCTSGNIGGSGFISGKSILTFRGKQTSNIDIFDGTLSFRYNENGEIHTEDITLWKNAVFDPRTTVGAWNDTASPSITIRGGGNFICDAGRTLTITN